MNNSTSSVVYKWPVESGKQGETVSAPSIRDYLEEISKDDNVNVGTPVEDTLNCKGPPPAPSSKKI
jgi:hypothetical protein